MKYKLDYDSIFAFRKRDLNALFLFDHIENASQLSLRLFWSSPSGMAPKDHRNVGYKGAVIIGTDDYNIVVKTLHK